MHQDIVSPNGSMNVIFCHEKWRIMTLLLVGSIMVLFLSGSDAWAHKVNLFAYVESGMVYTESYFADGKKVEIGTISVYDREGTQLVQGKTDHEGLFQFPIPKVDDLKIVIDAGMGHKSDVILKRKEVEEGK